MAKIDSIEKLTDNRFLNMYLVKGHNGKGYHSNYMVASRAEQIEDLKISTGKNTPDGVIIYAVYGEKKDRVVLVRQYRYPINGFVYEMPAGLVEKGEDYHEAAVRELHEETGLDFELVPADPMYEEPRFTTIGMTDESCATVYGYASGEISDAYAEPSEEIQVVLADREECRRILREERVSLNCAYSLMHFLGDEDPFAFLRN
uniref:NUDIX hydrolase n=1 Tax=Eubacterium cellulosolvens TaxID=29322 RepID=UPI00048550DE|nr:NUDIX hydrolase [[Eubacterium] cellulosolvens]